MLDIKSSFLIWNGHTIQKATKLSVCLCEREKDEGKEREREREQGKQERDVMDVKNLVGVGVPGWFIQLSVCLWLWS